MDRWPATPVADGEPHTVKPASDWSYYPALLVETSTADLGATLGQLDALAALIGGRVLRMYRGGVAPIRYGCTVLDAQGSPLPVDTAAELVRGVLGDLADVHLLT